MGTIGTHEPARAQLNAAVDTARARKDDERPGVEKMGAGDVTPDAASRGQAEEFTSDKRLTAAQFRLLALIVGFVRERGESPTSRDLGFKPGNRWQAHIGALEAKGYISRERVRGPKVERNSPRTVRVLRDHAVIRLPGMP